MTTKYPPFPPLNQEDAIPDWDSVSRQLQPAAWSLSHSLRDNLQWYSFTFIYLLLLQYFIQKCLIHFTDFQTVFRWKALGKRGTFCWCIAFTLCQILATKILKGPQPISGVLDTKRNNKKTKEENICGASCVGADCWALNFGNGC
jgi:hypothetical protein